MLDHSEQYDHNSVNNNNVNEQRIINYLGDGSIRF